MLCFRPTSASLLDLGVVRWRRSLPLDRDNAIVLSVDECEQHVKLLCNATDNDTATLESHYGVAAVAMLDERVRALSIARSLLQELNRALWCRVVAVATCARSDDRCRPRNCVSVNERILSFGKMLAKDQWSTRRVSQTHSCRDAPTKRERKQFTSMLQNKKRDSTNFAAARHRAHEKTRTKNSKHKM